MIRTLLKYLTGLLVFCLVAGLSAFFTLSMVIESEDTVVVPELRGKHAIAALEMLTDLGLNTKVEDSQYSDDIVKNHIISQEPAAGTVIKKDRDVVVVISKGTRRVTVPDLRGQPAARAEIILEENGLEAGNMAYVYSGSAVKDAVIAQVPEAGTLVKRTRDVAVLVSRGPRPRHFKMPDLTGRLSDEGMTAVARLGLRLEEVQPLHDPSRPENMILAQAPPAGYQVTEGEKIRLTVNRGSAADPPAHGRDRDRVLFSYRVPTGFLKQHIRLEMNCFGTRLTVCDRLFRPETLIWAIIPENVRASVVLYQNNELVRSETYGGFGGLRAKMNNPGFSWRRE